MSAADTKTAEHTLSMAQNLPQQAHTLVTCLQQDVGLCHRLIRAMKPAERAQLSMTMRYLSGYCDLVSTTEQNHNEVQK